MYYLYTLNYVFRRKATNKQFFIHFDWSIKIELFSDVIFTASEYGINK